MIIMKLYHVYLSDSNKIIKTSYTEIFFWEVSALSIPSFGLIS